MEIAGWLDGVGANLGEHAAVIESYGATTVADLGTLDDEDIDAIVTKLRGTVEPPALPPLQIKWIAKALRGEIKKAAAAALRTPVAMPPASGAAGSGDEQCDSADDDAEDSDSEGSGDGAVSARRVNTGQYGRNKAAGAAASTSTARAPARKGKAAARTSAAAASAGRTQIPSLFARSSSKSNWHGLGGQASTASAAAGRARPFGGITARGNGEPCVNPCEQKDGECTCPAEAEYPNCCAGPQKCARQLEQLVEGARKAAERTPSEIVKRGGTASKYNLARLKVYLLDHAFDGYYASILYLFWGWYVCMPSVVVRILFTGEDRAVLLLTFRKKPKQRWNRCKTAKIGPKFFFACGALEEASPLGPTARADDTRPLHGPRGLPAPNLTQG